MQGPGYEQPQDFISWTNRIRKFLTLGREVNLWQPQNRKYTKRMFVECMFMSKRTFLYLTLNTCYEIFWDFSKMKTAIACYGRKLPCQWPGIMGICLAFCDCNPKLVTTKSKLNKYKLKLNYSPSLFIYFC